MNRLILKAFAFLRNCLQLIGILLVFSILALLLYWVKEIANYDWDWLNFMTPFLSCIFSIGEFFSRDSIKLFSAEFEYKYFIALLILYAGFLVTHYGIKLLNIVEDFYKDGRKLARKFEENAFNKTLEIQQNAEQKQINNYKIYIKADIKQKFKNKIYNVNYEEQNIQLNKMLMEKTGVNPTFYENGYLYKFSDFDKIDKTLDLFNNLLKNESYLDYYISVVAFDKNNSNEDILKKIISLKLVNKISTTSNTVYRYNFNKNQKYNAQQVGLFSNENEKFEAYEFVEK